VSHDHEPIPEQFSRLAAMIGPEAFRILQRSFVAVAGLGAVGSYAVEALARAGVGRLRLIDCDVVRPSNINRQLYALNSTVGQSKCRLAAQRVLDINPACRVEARELFVHTDTLDRVLDGPPDLVIDAIDSLNPKVHLLIEAVKRNVPVLSAMGAALRTDPAAVRVGPLAAVTHCPLAAKVRKRLRQRGVPTDVPCIYSTEPVDPIPLAQPEEQEHHAQGRPRPALPSLPTLTGIFGLTAANAALRMLLGERFPGTAP